MDLIVLEILPGLEQFARDELVDQLSSKKFTNCYSGKGEECIATDLPLRSFLDLKVPVAASLSLHMPVDRPRTLLSAAYRERIQKAVLRVKKLQRGRCFSGVRLSAAGSGSDVMQRLQDAIADDACIPPDPEDGDLRIRLRPAREGGWEMLIRLTPRPLSSRAWRVANYRGALHASAATVAAQLTRPHPSDRVLNLMCGSATMLIERALLGKSSKLLGIDVSQEAILCAQKNIRAAGVSDRIDLIHGDVFERFGGSENFNVLFCDLPWGEALGRRLENQDLYGRLLELFPVCLTPDARAVVITQDTEAFHSVLNRQEAEFKMCRQVKYFQGGFHPTQFLLTRR